MPGGRKKALKLDEIGPWSEIKLDIVRDYATAYSKNLSAQEDPRLYHVYIDAFSGAGEAETKKDKRRIEGSPLIALNTMPPFREYHFVDLEETKVEHLQKMVGERKDVHVYQGDCNRILLDKIFPRVKWEDYRRGMCLLDPYGLHLDWEVIRTAGQMRSLDVFLNFPILDMNRNVFLWDKATTIHLDRMKAFWGDDSWRRDVFPPIRNAFPFMQGEEEKAGYKAIATAFRDRLKKVAGFAYVPDPIPMRNTKGAIIYYLFFASAKPVAQKIVTSIFAKYRNRGAV